MRSNDTPLDGSANSATIEGCEAKRELSELLGSLAELRGFVTEAELTRWGKPVRPNISGEPPLVRLLDLSKSAFAEEDDEAELRCLFELRVQTSFICLSGLTDDAIQTLASRTGLPQEDLEAARDLARHASTDARSVDINAARFLFKGLTPTDDADVNDLLAHLQSIGRWPGDESLPVVRAYQEVLNAAVVRHARFARRLVSQITGGGPLGLLMLASLDGLRVGLERFDPDRGHKPMTYAAWWARQRLLRLRAQYGFDIRLSIHFWQAQNRLHRAVQQALTEADAMPTIEELAKLLRPSEQTYVESIVLYGLLSPRDTWATIGTDGASEAEQLFDEEHIPPRRDAMRQALRKALEEVLDEIKNQKGRDTIRRRFPLDAHVEPETLESIGQSYGVTRERIRQIGEKALEMLAKQIGDRLREIIQGSNELP